jgi:hypothetical protein
MVYRALVDLLVVVEFVFFPMHGSPFPSCVVKVQFMKGILAT